MATPLPWPIVPMLAKPAEVPPRDDGRWAYEMKWDGGRRFANDAALAAYAGASPLEASSAGNVRHRLNRGGNRRLNAILYMIALSQARHSEQARAYLNRRVSEGKTRREAMRALKRFLVRAIWRLWQECYPVAAAANQRAAA